MIDQSVSTVMTPTVRTVTPETTASAVARLFADDDVGSAIVVDTETDEMVGIVTKSDILHQVAIDADISSVAVDSFMSAPVVTIDSDESIHNGATMMKDRSIRRLPVLDDGDLVGMLTTTDLTHYMPRLRNTVLRGRNDLASQ